MNRLFTILFIISLVGCSASFDDKEMSCRSDGDATARLCINCGAESIPYNYYSIDVDYSYGGFKESYRINFIKETDTHLHFEIGGVSVNSQDESSVAELLLNKETQVLSDKLNGYTLTCYFVED